MQVLVGVSYVWINSTSIRSKFIVRGSARPTSARRPLAGRPFHNVRAFWKHDQSRAEYDQSLIPGLSKVNDETMVLFVATSSGADPATSSERVNIYGSLVGQIDGDRFRIVVTDLDFR